MESIKWLTVNGRQDVRDRREQAVNLWNHHVIARSGHKKPKSDHMQGKASRSSSSTVLPWWPSRRGVRFLGENELVYGSAQELAPKNLMVNGHCMKVNENKGMRFQNSFLF